MFIEPAFPNRLKSGFTIAEFVISMALLSAFFYTLVSLFTWQEKSKNLETAKLEFDTAVTEIKKKLGGVNSCTQSLAGVMGTSVSSYPLGTATNIHIMNPLTGGMLASNGMDFYGNLKYSTVSLTALSPPIGTSQIVPVEINIEISDPSSTLKHSKKINVLLSSLSGNFIGCYLDQSEQSTCSAMGGSWNSGSIPKCSLSGQVLCESMNRIWDSANSTCKPLVCDAAFFATATKTVVQTYPTFNYVLLGHSSQRIDNVTFSPTTSGCYAFKHRATSNPVGYCYVGSSITIRDQATGTTVASGRGAPYCPCNTWWHMPWRCTSNISDWRIYVRLNAGVTYSVDRAWVGRGGGCAGTNYSSYTTYSDLSVELAN